jgi:hypothetical protein
MYKFLRFFNKDGNYTNFEYDENSDKWTGRVDMHTISTGLVENYDLFLLEEVWDSNNNLRTWTSPIGTTGVTGFNVSFDPKKPVEDIFVYTFTDGPSSSLDLNKVYNLDYDVITSSYSIGGTSFVYPGIKITSQIVSESIPLHFGFLPTTESGYSSILTIKDTNNHIVAEIEIYGEGEEEDERLKSMLSTLGHDLLPEDSIIFDSFDVNEEGIDWRLINRKRKELLLEHSNIFPYLGSYKALINIIKFFGYQNVRMKEYWKNVDITSPNYLKYRQTNIIDIFSENANFSDTQLIPSKIYKKTSKFGLFYDINVVTEEFDESGLPLTEEVFTFTPEEVLIKIYALKKKLQNYYLPVNAKIVDIIGEAVYFAQYKIQSINEQNRIDSVSLGLKPKISVSPSNRGDLQDLRPLYNLGFPVGPDLNSGGYTDLWSYVVDVNSNIITNTGQFVDIIMDFSLNSTNTIAATLNYRWDRDVDSGNVLYTQGQICQKLSELINDKNGKYIFISGSTGSSYISDSFYAYPENSGSSIRIIEKTHNPSIDVIKTVFDAGSTAPYNPPTVYPTGGTSNYVNVSLNGTFGPSGAPMSYYSDTFLGYFNKTNIPISQLNDAEDIPVGYPVVLHNDTFNITWDDANVTYNQVDQKNPDVIGPFSQLMYSNFNNSYTVSGWTSISNYGASGATYVSIPVTQQSPGFPSNFPSQGEYSWINLGFYGYYEMQWIVSGPSGFYYDSGQKPITDINNLSLILPYVGSYKIELYLWDLYNTRSMLIEDSFINVTVPESDFLGWYQKRELTYDWNSTKYDVQSDFVQPTPPLGSPLKSGLTWDEYSSTWDLPLHPNEEIGMAELSTNSLDSIEFYQSMINPIDNPLVDRYPFNFNLIGNQATWDDSYHLWWDNTGTRISEFVIKDLPGPICNLFMNRGNCTINLDGSLDVRVINGPTGWTGATATDPMMPIGTTAGESIKVLSNKRVYVWDGTDWTYTIEELDAISITVGSGSTASKMKQATHILNNITLQTNPVFSDFIFYYSEAYDSNYALQPYIKAVSKKFDKGGRHRILIPGSSNYDEKSFETVYFGYLGDIPTHFEIFDIPSSLSSQPSISVSYENGGISTTVPYYIGSTSLEDLANELNGPTAQAYPGIGDFTYNIVLGASGYTGGIGPTSSLISSVKIQGVSKSFTSPQTINVRFTGNIKGTTYGRSLIKNPSWDDLRILKYTEAIPLLTVLNFTYDNSKVRGKKNPKWTLSKEGDPNFENIYYNNKYFSYMFTKRGNYSVSLDLEDSNGNIRNVTKKEIIKII